MTNDQSPTADDDFQALMKELREASDRSLAIVGIAVIEDALQSAIISRLQLTGDAGKALFNDGGALNAARHKATMAWALGLIGNRTRGDLKCLAEIRNRFAHQMHERSFDVPYIATRCDRMTDRTPSIENASRRDRFYYAVRDISISLGVDALFGHRVRSGELD